MKKPFDAVRIQIFSFVRKRPLSALLIALGLFGLAVELVQISLGNLYMTALSNVDGTTLLMMGVLLLWGIFSLRSETDFQAVAFSFVAVLSFVLAYEATFKWSFYLFPFMYSMPNPELRLFLIEGGSALTVLAGLAEGHFRIKKWTLIWFGLFALLWIIWLSVGFPQLSGQVMYSPVVPIPFTPAMTYVINRATKVVLFFVYLTLFPAVKNAGSGRDG